MLASSLQNNSPALALRNLSWRENLFAAIVALVVLGVVVNFAWLSEDCFITLRYVSNTINGYGPVFNIGERVQGYTHPLWFVTLASFSLIFRNPMLVAYGCSFLFTFLTVLFVGRAILQAAPRFLPGAILLCLAALVWCTSDPWVSFQTGGLENCLSHLLIVAIVWEAWVWSATRPVRLMTWLCLLCLTRPDFVLWTAPLAILLLARVPSFKQFSFLALAIVPAIAWLLFALLFYRDILPNTFYAKVGIYPSLSDSVSLGLGYLVDWFHYDTLAAGASLLFLIVAASAARTLPRIALLLGILLIVGWIIEVGGDFMRGRFFTPVLTAAMFIGSLAFAEKIRAGIFKGSWRSPAFAGILAVLAFARLGISEPPDEGANRIIANERKFYPGYSLSFYLRHGRVENPYLNLELAKLFRNYVLLCGPFTVHVPNPGTIGYLAGPEVTVIDTLGLTDAFIAKLPKETLVKKISRPGHPEKRIPLSYLFSRNDLSLIPNYVELMRRGECGLSAQLDQLKKTHTGNLVPR